MPSVSFPAVQGAVETQVSLSAHTWFRVGGPADFVFYPAGVEDLRCFLKSRPKGMPYTVLGAGSNVLVRSGGVRGAVIFLNRAFSGITLIDDHHLDVGAGVLDKKVAKVACEHGIGGLEFLYTIPGTIGGAVRMNAGAYGRETNDLVVYAIVMDPKGRIHRLSSEELGLGHRTCAVPSDWIVLSVRLKGEPRPPAEIQDEMERLTVQRRATQPSGKTGGSTFKNPLEQSTKKAWQLIREAGCADMRVGDASLSDVHANFMMNNGAATAEDLETLGERVREQVQEKTGVLLEWEIHRLGEPA